MNNTVALPELAARIAQLSGADNDIAARFVTAVFSCVEKALAEGGCAIISGIGTFRNDNGKVSFEPDESLAAAINAPFAMFEPMELPPDINADIFADNPAEQERQTMTEPEPESAPEPSPEPYAESIVEDNYITPIKTKDEPEVEIEAEAEIEAIAETETDESQNYYETSGNNPWPWIAAAACLLIGLASGYWIGSRFAAPQPIIIAGTEYPIDLKIEENIGNSEDSIAPNAVIEQKCDSLIKEEGTHSPQKDPKEKIPVYDTVTSSRFLTTIARDHYGRKDYWVFIYEANSEKLKHPNRIRPGTQVVIPDLGPHAALDPDMRARARKLANEIYTRYDL